MNKTKTGLEQTVVQYHGLLTVIRIDHDKQRMNAYSLTDGQWQKVDVVGATHSGAVLHDKTLEGLPPLPPM